MDKKHPEFYSFPNVCHKKLTTPLEWGTRGLTPFCWFCPEVCRFRCRYRYHGTVVTLKTRHTWRWNNNANLTFIPFANVIYDNCGKISIEKLLILLMLGAPLLGLVHKFLCYAILICEGRPLQAMTDWGSQENYNYHHLIYTFPTTVKNCHF